MSRHEGLQIMRILAQDFTITGTAELPQAEPSEREYLLSAPAMDQWLSCEARISKWRFNAPDLLLRLVLRDGVYDAFVSLPAAAAPPDHLFGARVRLTGIVTFTPALGRVMFVPDVKQFKLLEPGTENVFDTPLVTISQVRQQQIKVGQCVRVRGNVLGSTTENVLHLREGSAAIRIQTQLPWKNTDKPHVAVSTGDVIEVVGFQIAHDGSLMSGFDLEECHLRVTGKAEVPQPVTSALKDIASGNYTAELVETRGRLITLQQVQLEHGEWRTTMLLESEGSKLPVALHTQGRPALDTIKTDDDMLVRGLVEPGNAVDLRQIRLLGADAVKSLGLSSTVRARQLWLWVASILAVVLIFSGWIVALQKSNRIKTEVAAQLEERVTERTAALSQAQTELTRALDQERELSELKSRFVTMVSHEFRTPLGIIMSAVELLQHYSDRLPDDEKQRQLQEIQSSTKHMGSLMEQVLVLGRVEAGKLTCKPVPLAIAYFAERIIDEIQSITNRKCPITLQTEGEITNANADESLLRHILGNLVTNAVKYSPIGSAVVLRIHCSGGQIVFDVIDHGIGIPKKDRARLFEAFHRCSNVGDTPGTGLGLVIVKRCVDLHGGTLEVRSEADHGSTFTVSLPIGS